MDLHLASSKEGDATVVAVRGELDALSAPQLDAQLAQAMAEQPAYVAVDLTDVSFIDSTGLGVIIKSLRHMREHGGDLGVVVASPRVAKVFAVTGMDQVMASAETLPALLQGR